MSTKKLQPTVFAAGLMILIKDNHVLLLLRSKNAKYAPGAYTLPSGSKEKNETALQSAIRETEEEVQVKIDPSKAEFVQIMLRKKPTGEEWVDFFFVARKWKGIPLINEPDKCESVEWFPLNKLPENTIPFIKAALENIQKGIRYSEYGFEN